MQLTHPIPDAVTRNGSLEAHQVALGALPSLLAGLACVVAPMLAFTIKPSTTLLNQVAALFAWGLFATAIARSQQQRAVSLGHAGPLLAALLLLMAGVLASYLVAYLPLSMALASAGGLLAAMVLMYAGVLARQAGYTASLMTALSAGWVTLGLLSVLVGCLQAFAPALTGNDWIAATSFPGRAVGNIRQPNQLATYLLLASVGLIWLNEMGRLRRGWLAILLAVLVFGVVLSGSRTGQFGLIVMTIWAWLDRRLTPTSRRALMWSPVMMAVAWVGLYLWAQFTEQSLGAASRVGDGLGSSRFGVWLSAWEMIKQYPLTGVGWGGFNLAWTLTPNANRLVETFDNAHNLPLHLIAELGLPLGLLVVGLLCWALVRAFAAGSDGRSPESTALRCAFMMVLLVGIHSLMEFPLWYFYFLLPTALLWGLCLGARTSSEEASDRSAPGRTGALKLAGMLVMAMGLVTLLDFMRVARIYDAKASALPLIERIERAQGAWLFAPQADTAFATHYPPGEAALSASKRAAPRLIDLLLLRAWAESLHATGDDERARFLAQRLREFQHENFFPWFAQCDVPVPEGQPKPFQCTPPTKSFTYRDML